VDAQTTAFVVRRISFTEDVFNTTFSCCIFRLIN